MNPYDLARQDVAEELAAGTQTTELPYRRNAPAAHAIAHVEGNRKRFGPEVTQSLNFIAERYEKDPVGVASMGTLRTGHVGFHVVHAALLSSDPTLLAYVERTSTDCRRAQHHFVGFCQPHGGRRGEPTLCRRGWHRRLSRPGCGSGGGRSDTSAVSRISREEGLSNWPRPACLNVPSGRTLNGLTGKGLT